MLKQSFEHTMKITPPMIENQWQQISDALSDSLRRHVKVTIKLDDPVKDREVRGFVTVINTYLEEIKLREEDEWLWIKFSDILSVHT